MLFKAATIKLHFCWHWWSLWTKVVWVQIQPQKLKSAYLGHKDTSILNYNWCIKKLKTPMKQFERHIGMNCIEARLWFSVMQPSVPSTRRQTSSEISWSRSRWPVSDPMMFRSSCSLWSPASLKQHQQTRYTKIIIWEPFLFWRCVLGGWKESQTSDFIWSVLLAWEWRMEHRNPARIWFLALKLICFLRSFQNY